MPGTGALDALEDEEPAAAGQRLQVVVRSGHRGEGRLGVHARLVSLGNSAIGGWQLASSQISRQDAIDYILSSAVKVSPAKRPLSLSPSIAWRRGHDQRGRPGAAPPLRPAAPRRGPDHGRRGGADPRALGPPGPPAAGRVSQRGARRWSTATPAGARAPDAARPAGPPRRARPVHVRGSTGPTWPSCSRARESRDRRATLRRILDEAPRAGPPAAPAAAPSRATRWPEGSCSRSTAAGTTGSRAGARSSPWWARSTTRRAG